MALTQSELKNLHVGQDLYMSRSRRHQDGLIITIEKIGRLYAYARHIKIHLETGKIKSEFTSYYEIWMSEDAYNKEAALTSAWDKFRLECTHTYKYPAGISVEVIKELSDKLGFNPDKW